MTELTPDEILAAIRRGLEATARRFADRQPDQRGGQPQPADDPQDPAPRKVGELKPGLSLDNTAEITNRAESPQRR